MQLEMDLLKLKVLANESNEHFAKNAASTLNNSHGRAPNFLADTAPQL